MSLWAHLTDGWMAGPSQRDSSWSLRERDEAPSAMDNDNRAWIEKRTDSVQFFCFQGWPQKAEGRRQVRNLAARSRSVVTKTSFFTFSASNLESRFAVLPSFLPNCPSSFFCYRSTLSRVSSLRTTRKSKTRNNINFMKRPVLGSIPSTAPRIHRSSGQIPSLTLLMSGCTRMRSLWF